MALYAALALAACLLVGLCPLAEAAPIDLTRAVVVPLAGRTGREGKALAMLLDEVERRTRIRWAVAASRPRTGPCVALEKRGWDGARPEGYAIETSGSTVTIRGADARGLLFGVGRLLRELLTNRDSAILPEPLDVTSSPAYPVRGHQLGYRPKTNSYDGWTLAMWEQYIRELAIFGANSVELIPPKSDDAPDSPMFPKPQMETLVGMSRLLDQYGLDVWIWYPAMAANYADPKTAAAELKDWASVVDRLPRVDAVFVPGGDPGHTQPKVLMGYLARFAPLLHRRHPKAGIWVAPQGFSAEWFSEFIGILTDQKPEWLTGVVFGPQLRLPLKEFRAIVPARYAIRHYPDITHTIRCEYPVPDWDVAFALTEGREPINPRPIDEATICRTLSEGTVGAICYSEGCNDDVNKAVWSALLWDPNANLREVLRQYGRAFISGALADRFAEGLFALERNWRGAARDNAGIDETLRLFQQLEAEATPRDRLNWRFQQALYRAYYDALVRARSIVETEQEARANAALLRAPEIGSERAIAEAEAILSEAVPGQAAPDLRRRLCELAEALFQSIRMQLSVKKYFAIGAERGANLDAIDAPLNNRVWLRERFAEVRKTPGEPERVAALLQLAKWSSGGPGGFYDAPGDPARRAHVATPVSFDRDPGGYVCARTGFGGDSPRLEWRRYLETLYDQPLTMRWTGLDPRRSYRLRVVYGGDNIERKIRCTAGSGVVIHDWLRRPWPQRPLEFEAPASATAGGELTATWIAEPGAGGNGRALQVCEVWLEPVSPSR